MAIHCDMNESMKISIKLNTQQFLKLPKHLTEEPIKGINIPNLDPNWTL